MQIPQPLQPFAKPTLIALTDNVKARLLLAKDDQVQELGTLTPEKENVSSSEAMAGQSPHLSSTPEMKEHDQHILHDHLYPMLSMDLMKRKQNGDFEDLVIFIDEIHKGILEEQLHPSLKENLKIISKIVMKESLKEIIERVQA